jgi:hypothetical protein
MAEAQVEAQVEAPADGAVTTTAEAAVAEAAVETSETIES